MCSCVNQWRILFLAFDNKTFYQMNSKTRNLLLKIELTENTFKRPNFYHLKIMHSQVLSFLLNFNNFPKFDENSSHFAQIAVNY